MPSSNFQYQISSIQSNLLMCSQILPIQQIESSIRSADQTNLICLLNSVTCQLQHVAQCKLQSQYSTGVSSERQSLTVKVKVCTMTQTMTMTMAIYSTIIYLVWWVLFVLCFAHHLTFISQLFDRFKFKPSQWSLHQLTQSKACNVHEAPQRIFALCLGWDNYEWWTTCQPVIEDSGLPSYLIYTHTIIYIISKWM